MWLHISVVSAGFTFRDSARSENRWSPSALVQVESEQGSFATPAPLAGNSPETAGNVGDYSVMQPTPRPAPFMGTFCRGGACQYRVQLPTDEPLPSPWPFPTAFPPGVVYPQNQREFCRGLSCPPEQGWPADFASTEGVLNCAHLYFDVADSAGEAASLGSKGHPFSLDKLRQITVSWCEKRVGFGNAGDCPGLADVFVMAMVGSADKPSIGSVEDVCKGFFVFNDLMQQAAIDLKLLQETLPKPIHNAALLAGLRKRFGADRGTSIGPSSQRGVAFRQWYQHRLGHVGRGPLPAAELPVEPLAELPPAALDVMKGVFRIREVVSFEQKDAAGGPPKQGAADQYHYQLHPEYKQNAPCNHNVQSASVVYKIADGNPNVYPPIPPAEISGPLMEHCTSQFAEVMLGAPATGEQVITMVKEWCSWQGAVTDWLNQAAGMGRPDWDVRTCLNMGDLVSFALRYKLQDEVSSSDVCSHLFLSLGAMTTVKKLIKDAWNAQGERGAAVVSVIDNSGADAAMQKALKAAEAYSKKVYEKLNNQKAAYDDVMSIKMDQSAFSSFHNTVESIPELPRSSQFGLA